MKRLMRISMAGAILAFTSAEACYIVDKQETNLGVDSGIEGRCANNGWRIACTVTQDEEGISCEGPEGVFQGDKLGFLVMAACGCLKQQTLQQQLEQQLQAYP